MSILRRIWSRRKQQKRVRVELEVRSETADGEPCTLRSEDLSGSGIRLRFDHPGLGPFLGHREEIPLEIQLNGGDQTIRSQARLVWAYNAAGGGMVSGWQFVSFEGQSQETLTRFVEGQ